MSLAAISLGAISQEKWINVASSDDSSWEVQPRSLEETKTKGGNEIAAVVGRIANKKTKKVELRKWYVSIEDCDRKMGKLVTLDIDGKFQFENDFVFGAGTIATSVAEGICGGYEYRVQAKDKKGI